MKGFSSKIINIPKMTFIVKVKTIDSEKHMFTGLTYFTSLAGIKIKCEKKEIFETIEVGKKYTVSGLLYSNDHAVLTDASHIEEYIDPPVKYHKISEIEIPRNIEKDLKVCDLLAHVNYKNFEETKKSIDEILEKSSNFSLFCFISRIIAMLDTNPYFFDLYYEICFPYVSKNRSLLTKFFETLNENDKREESPFLLLKHRLEKDGIFYNPKTNIKERYLETFDRIRTEGTAEYYTVRDCVDGLKKCEITQKLVNIAAITGSVECYEYLISQGKSPGEENSIALGGSIPLMEKLNVNKPMFLLHKVIGSQKNEAIDWFLEKYKLETPLFYGVLNNNPFVTLLALQNGSSPEDCSIISTEPLSAAITRFKTMISAILLDYGASLDPLNSDPVDLALKYDCSVIEPMEKKGLEVTDELILNVIKAGNEVLTRIVLKDHLNKKILQFGLLTAVQRENNGIIKLLLEYGADPDEKSSVIESSFDCAVKRNLTESLRTLLEAKPHPAKADSYLSTLVRNNDIDNVVTLIKNGANPNVVGDLNQTPLQAAILQNNIKMLNVLIDNGADVNYGKKTPLMFATIANNIEIAKVLLSKGADPNKESSVGFGKPLTPAQKAEKDKKMELLELFNKHSLTLSSV